MRRPILTRRRLLITTAVILVTALAAWFGLRKPVAAWVVRRGLAAAGLEPAIFQVRSVGLGAVHLADLSVGIEPWLVAGSVEVTYGLADLAAGRVTTIVVRDARWTVQVREGVIDWGWVPKKTGDALTLDMPCDRADLRESVIRVIVDGTAHDIPIAAQLTPTAPRGISGRFDLLVLGRTMTLTARAKSEKERLTMEVTGHAGYPRARATAPPVVPHSTSLPPDAGTTAAQGTLNATLHRMLGDGSTLIDLNITLESLAEHVGALDIAFAQASVTGQVGFDASGGITKLTSSLIVQDLHAGGIPVHAVELKAQKADGPRVALEVVAGGDGWQLPGAHGTATLGTGGDGRRRPHSAIVVLEMQTTKPVSLDWRSSGITGLIASVAGSMKVQVDGSGLSVLEGALTINGGSLESADFGLSSVEARAVMRSPDAVDVTGFSAILGDGGTLTIAPFAVDPRTPRVQTRLSVTNLSLAEWLPLITKDHATGEGRVSGHVDTAIDLTSGTPRLAQLSGALRADPQHGFIQVADADAVGTLLDAQDSRFATDEVMRPVRDKIVAALQDFAFHALTVDLSQQDDETIARAYLSGFGRHGEDPQGLNLTLDLHVRNGFADLVSRILDLSRTSAAARNAINRFFEAPASEDTRP